MNAWKLEKDKILAITKNKSGIMRYLTSCCDMLLNKYSPLKTKINVIQMKIIMNQTKFNKKLRFHNFKGVY